MSRNLIILFLIITIGWFICYHPQAHWSGELIYRDPTQISEHFPAPWLYKNYTIIPRAKYHLKGVVLSKHHYWGIFREDSLSSYDLCLGWGPISIAKNINQLHFSQAFRWCNYHWINPPPLDPSLIISHSSNNHIITDNPDIQDQINSFKINDIVELDGYLVDIISNKDNWTWHTSLSRTDTGDGACEVFWVNTAFLSEPDPVPGRSTNL